MASRKLIWCPVCWDETEHRRTAGTKRVKCQNCFDEHRSKHFWNYYDAA